MKVTTKGQVTIPQHIRKHLGIHAYNSVEFLIKEGEVVLVKAENDDTEDQKHSKFSALRGIKSDGLTTEEWMSETRGE